MDAVFLWISYGKTAEIARLSPEEETKPELLGGLYNNMALTAAALFFLRIQLPPIIINPIGYLAALNTPLPMLVIGYKLSQADFGTALRDRGIRWPLYAGREEAMLLMPNRYLRFLPLGDGTYTVNNAYRDAVDWKSILHFYDNTSV